MADLVDRDVRKSVSRAVAGHDRRSPIENSETGDAPILATMRRRRNVRLENGKYLGRTRVSGLESIEKDLGAVAAAGRVKRSSRKGPFRLHDDLQSIGSRDRSSYDLDLFASDYAEGNDGDPCGNRVIVQRQEHTLESYPDRAGTGEGSVGLGRKNGMKRSLFLLPLLLLAGVASAAPDPFDFRVADVGLLQAKQVQTAVGITAAQRTKMNTAADTYKKRLETYQKQLQALGTVNPDKAKVRGLFEALKKDVVAVLTPAQLRRVRELTLQRLGLVSLTDATVAKKVGLSTAQVGKIRSAFGAGRAKFAALQQKAQTAAAPIAAQYKGRKPKSEAEAASLRKEIEGKLRPIQARSSPSSN